jgi:hypothetical protein
MTRQEYILAIAPAMSAWRVAIRRSALITVPINVGFVFWLFHLIEVRDPDLESKFLVGVLVATVAMVATTAYMSVTFSRLSPTCQNCGNHLRFLQLRRVLKGGKCDYCHAGLFEA